jgi:hypothetical protein
VTSAEYKLDLTRPDLKDINKDSLVEVDSAASYDSSSPLNRAAMEQEIKSIQGRQQELDRFGTFADQELRNDINNLLQGNGAAGQN